MQERVSALAVCMCFPVQPGKVATQLVVKAFYMVRVCLANRVLPGVNDRSIGPMLVRAVLDMAVRRQLRLQHLRCLCTSATQSKAHNLVSPELYCPPEPDWMFFETT